MTIFLVSVVIVIIAYTANSQDCRLYTTAQLETLLSSSITVEPNTVCLASGTQRDTYQEASVVVTLNGVVRQVELSCSSSPSTWGVTTNNLASADATSSLRRDCASCAASSGDTSLDNVTHCVRKLLIHLFVFITDEKLSFSLFECMHWSSAVHIFLG